MIAPHESATEEIVSLAALYAMRALDAAEASAFEGHFGLVK